LWEKSGKLNIGQTEFEIGVLKFSVALTPKEQELGQWYIGGWKAVELIFI
jgi:hypothetical protein